VLNVDYIVIGHTAGAVTLGLYVLAFNISSWPVNALVQTVRNVALPGFARLDRAKSAESFVSSFALVLAAGLLVGVLLGPLARPVVTFVYGPTWLRSAGALGVLALFGAMRVVFDLMATFLIARGASRPVLLVQIAWVVALVPAMVVGVHARGLVGAGIAHLVVALAVVLPAYTLTLNRQGVRFHALVRAAAPPVGAAAVAAIAVWATSQLTGAAWQRLLLGSAVGIAVYLALLQRWLRARLTGSWPTDRQHPTRQHRRTSRSSADIHSRRPERAARGAPLWRSSRRGSHRLVRDRHSRSPFG
jgi:PST family polysaccharide transporter